MLKLLIFAELVFPGLSAKNKNTDINKNVNATTERLKSPSVESNATDSDSSTNSTTKSEPIQADSSRHSSDLNCRSTVSESDIVFPATRPFAENIEGASSRAAIIDRSRSADHPEESPEGKHYSVANISRESEDEQLSNVSISHPGRSHYSLPICPPCPPITIDETVNAGNEQVPLNSSTIAYATGDYTVLVGEWEESWEDGNYEMNLNEEMTFEGFGDMPRSEVSSQLCHCRVTDDLMSPGFCLLSPQCHQIAREPVCHDKATTFTELFIEHNHIRSALLAFALIAGWIGAVNAAHGKSYAEAFTMAVIMM